MISESLQNEIAESIIYGDLPIFKKFEYREFTFYAEEWETFCIEDCLKGDEEDDDLFDLVLEKAEEIQKEEGWNNFFYIPPEKCGVPLGITVFYKRK